MKNNNNKNKVINIEQLKICGYCMKFQRFLTDV